MIDMIELDMESPAFSRAFLFGFVVVIIA